MAAPPLRTPWHTLHLGYNQRFMDNSKFLSLPRWYHLTIDRTIVGLVAFEGFLLLSEWFDWFVFNGETWTALIAVAGTALAMVFLLLWFMVARLLHRPFQYGLRSLMLLVVVVAILCSWIAIEMRQERKQRAVAEEIGKLGGKTETEVTWLGRLLRDDSLVSVTQANLFCTAINDTELLHFQELRQLRVLEFTNTKVSDAGFAYLQGMRRLEVLVLNDTRVSDANLARLEGLSQLLVLVLDGTEVTDAGLVHLQGLRQLKWLHLDNTKITDAGLVHLQQLTELQWLTLNNTKVTDAGLAHLDGLRHLELLMLEGTQVTDAGLQYLEGMNQLKRLELNGTKVTDAGLAHLQGLRQLEDLSLEETQVTDAGVKKLEYALPNCKVTHANKEKVTAKAPVKAGKE